MSKLINVSDAVYDELTLRKKMRNESYTEVIAELLLRHEHSRKTIGWDEILEKIRKRDMAFKGKKEKIDHDLIAHGVSRDSA